LTTPTYVVIVGAVLNGAGSSTFFPANNSAVMASAPARSYGVVSGLLRTFSNIGMVCSFAVALLVASVSIPRQMAFEIFLGVGGFQSQLSSAFVDGMHAALAGSISVIIIALILSILRGKEARTVKPPATV
jgi:MFS family permease